MNIKSYFLLLFLLSLLLWPQVVFCNSIFDVKISPALPCSLTHGEKIWINFSYSTNKSGGVRVFVRPMSEGKRAPNYAASGSPLYPAGSGTGRSYFTIRSGDVFVSDVRFVMKSDSGHVLYRRIVPTQYMFSKNPFHQASRSEQDMVIRSDGIVEIRKPDGSAVLIAPDGRRGIRKPNGQEQWFSVNLIPTEPPVLVSEADEEWINDMNKWLEVLGNNMISNIRTLSGSDSNFKNYKNYEDANCETLYERLALRQIFIKHLIGSP